MSEPESKELEEELKMLVFAMANPGTVFSWQDVQRICMDAMKALREKDEEIAHLNHLRHEDAQILDEKDAEIARLKFALSGKTFYEKPCESCGEKDAEIVRLKTEIDEMARDNEDMARERNLNT